LEQWLEKNRLIEENDFYMQVGQILELLAHSDYHRQHPTIDYCLVEIFPAINCGQVKVYVTPDGKPFGFVTWAWLTQVTEQEILTTGRALRVDEWKCGSHLFFNDWVAPFGSLRQMVHDLRANIFPDQKQASSIRRNANASIRKVNRWWGKPS
jgi:cytolysin-activating lysine-acyltransferase